MAVKCDLPVQGGMTAVGAYLRITQVTGKKNRQTGTFYATGNVQAFVSADEAAEEHGVTLVTPVCQAVKKTGVDITGNVLAQLYEKLEEDLAAAGATNIEEAQ